jgi:hypothetical protein
VVAATRLHLLEFWTRDFRNLGIMKLENSYPPVHANVVVPVLKENLNGSNPTKHIIMIPVPVPIPVLKQFGFQFFIVCLLF